MSLLHAVEPMAGSGAHIPLWESTCKSFRMSHNLAFTGGQMVHEGEVAAVGELLEAFRALITSRTCKRGRAPLTALSFPHKRTAPAQASLGGGIPIDLLCTIPAGHGVVTRGMVVGALCCSGVSLVQILPVPAVGEHSADAIKDDVVSSGFKSKA
eukprot:CAMPEP_0201499148 /NCGR_PEP_ID=MMETSP0151_2-20130828/74674_1 /ASSEMBLY_ACC=CAM_ASM_000257 /TAXON_ID=200890 /ORGANISM="Paramoeba atlantica, Strain 621/1 / CCAP 1560/9" /LENGTH=154 /DNA_ID=CAMNT_0047891257 /DNA_START=166 /DNA_END=631 /DNA_ORIENTATION=+